MNLGNTGESGKTRDMTQRCNATIRRTGKRSPAFHCSFFYPTSISMFTFRDTVSCLCKVLSLGKLQRSSNVPAGSILS